MQYIYIFCENDIATLVILVDNTTWHFCVSFNFQEMNNSAANEDDDEGSEDGYPAPRDFGVGGVNRTCARPTSNLCGYAAIHLAIQEGHEVKNIHGIGKKS